MAKHLERTPIQRAAWIAAPLGRCGRIAASVVFPAPKTALIPRPLGRFRSVALLRLVDETVWLLSMPGRAWTDSRLDTAAGLLAGSSANPEPNDVVAQRLRSGLDLPDLMLVTPCLDTVDPSQWGLADTARSMVRRGTNLPPMVQHIGDLKRRNDAVESMLRVSLRDALAAFVAALDAEALTAASANGRIDAIQYNYLAYRPHRRYRLQFAAAFPNLLPAAASASSGTLGADVRTAVDSGRPLVKTLARNWGVRPGVVRMLMAVPPAAIGRKWTGDIRALALLLNALRPADLPAAEPSTWNDFDAAVGVGGQVFHEALSCSSAARGWLRDCVGQLRRGSPTARARWLPDADAVEGIRRFRALLTETLRHDAGAASVDAAQAVSRFLPLAVDRLLVELAPRGLADVVTAFETERARAHRGIGSVRENRRIALGRMLLPLLPRDFVSSDGSRVIRGLTTEAQLAEHGRDLGICLAGVQRHHYLAACRHGQRFIVGIFEAVTGAPLSTVDIVIRRDPKTGIDEPMVAQHTARENQEPSPTCRRAVAELLRHCCRPEVIAHLQQGRRLLRRDGRTQMTRLREQTDAATLAADRAALQATLGDGVYDDLVAATIRARRRHCGID